MKITTKIIKIINKNQHMCMPEIRKASTIIFNNYHNIKKNIKKNKNIYYIGVNNLSKYLEKIIKTLDRTKYVIIVESGLLAFSLICLTFIKKNYFIIVPKNIYNPNLKIIKYISNNYNNKIKQYNMEINNIKKKANIIIIEAPGSIDLKTPNINKLIKNYSNKKTIIIIDNTYSSGLSKNFFNIGINISIQALTKYQSGGNDILMGSITTNNKKIFNKIKKTKKLLGLHINSEDIYIILRSIKNLKYRYKKIGYKTLKIIKWLSQFKIIKNIFHPKNKKDKSYYYFNNYFKYSNGLFSFEFKKYISIKKIIKFVNNLKIIKIGYSWGGNNSLIMIYNKYKKTIIRISIGMENNKDIKKDIIKSIKKMFLF